MIIEHMDQYFKVHYYPTTQNIVDTIDYDPTFNNAKIFIVNLNHFVPIKDPSQDAMIFNMAIIEIVMLHIGAMIDSSYIEDLMEDIDSNVLEVFIGKDIFNKYRHLLISDTVRKLINNLMSLTVTARSDTIMLGWLKKGNTYDAGFANL